MPPSISCHVSRPPLRLHSISWKPPFQPLTLARAKGVKNPQNRSRSGTKANVITASANHPSHKFLKWSVSHSVASNFLQPHGLQPTQLPYPWSSPGKNPGMGCHFLVQGIFSTQRLNLGLPRCRQFLDHLSHQGISCWGHAHKWWQRHDCEVTQRNAALRTEILTSYYFSWVRVFLLIQPITISFLWISTLLSIEIILSLGQQR